MKFKDIVNSLILEDEDAAKEALREAIKYHLNEAMATYNMVNWGEKVKITSRFHDKIEELAKELKAKGYDVKTYYIPATRKTALEIEDVSEQNLANIEMLADEVFQ